MPIRKRLLMLSPLILLAFVAFIALGGVIVRLLWNWLLPPIFGLREITVWQALGLLALSRILFGGFCGGGMARSGVRRRMAERWELLTPEERERCRARMRERWGFGPPSGESPGQ